LLSAFSEGIVNKGNGSSLGIILSTSRVSPSRISALYVPPGLPYVLAALPIADDIKTARWTEHYQIFIMVIISSVSGKEKERTDVFPGPLVSLDIDSIYISEIHF